MGVKRKGIGYKNRLYPIPLSQAGQF